MESSRQYRDRKDRLLAWVVAVILLAGAISLGACTKKSAKSNEIWVYTSLYKDTISDITLQLEKDMPGVKVRWFQAGSEEIAAKVNAELLAGKTKADVLISSDRFWYEELAQNGHLEAFAPKGSEEIKAEMKHPLGYYTTVSHPVMMMVYNNEVFSKDRAPKSFKDMTAKRWKDKFTTGSALASGTNFTTVSMLQKHYGWKYFKDLRKNNVIAEGGNSAVLNRVLSKERPVGAVLLENVLRFHGADDKRLSIVVPDDGPVLISNVLALVKKDGKAALAKQFANWMFSRPGQEAMIRSFMYSPLTSMPAPQGAPPLAEVKKKAFKWSPKFIGEVVKQRNAIKEQYAQIMFE